MKIGACHISNLFVLSAFCCHFLTNPEVIRYIIQANTRSKIFPFSSSGINKQAFIKYFIVYCLFNIHGQSVTSFSRSSFLIMPVCSDEIMLWMSCNKDIYNDFHLYTFAQNEDISTKYHIVNIYAVKAINQFKFICTC
jgi:hypothetical protein